MNSVVKQQEGQVVEAAIGLLPMIERARTAPTAPSRKPDVHQQPADDFADDLDSIPF